MLIFITAIIVFIICLPIAIKAKNNSWIEGISAGLTVFSVMILILISIFLFVVSAKVKTDAIVWKNNHDMLIYQLEEIHDMSPTMTLDLFDKVNQYNTAYEIEMTMDRSWWLKGLTQAKAIRRAGVGRIEIIRYMEDD